MSASAPAFEPDLSFIANVKASAEPEKVILCEKEVNETPRKSFMEKLSSTSVENYSEGLQNSLQSNFLCKSRLKASIKAKVGTWLRDGD